MRRLSFLVLCSAISVLTLSAPNAPAVARASSFSSSATITAERSLTARLWRQVRVRRSNRHVLHVLVRSASDVAWGGALAPTGLSAGQLRLPGTAFAPAGINPGYDYAESAATADGNWFRNNHWWSFTRLGMAAGYYERADAQDSGGNPIYFRWQAEIYPSSAAASATIQDGISRTNTYGGAGGGCYYIFHVPCYGWVYGGVNGTDTQSYQIVQVNQCVGDIAATAEQSVYDNDSDAISQTFAQAAVAGERLLQSLCRGASAQTASTQTHQQAAPSSATGGFHGNCYTYQSQMWGITQRIATLQGQWWNDLQTDYNGNYPPPSGGSTPGVTGAQFQAAQQDMVAINQQLDDQPNRTGAEWDIVGLDLKYGINVKSNQGPFNWAADRVFGAAYGLELAAYHEWQQTGTGLGDYHTAQQYLSNAWDALKQLPCQALAQQAQSRPAQPAKPKSSPAGNSQSLSVSAWVSPSSMPYSAYPTLYAKTAPGATCTASVEYTTGYPPRSFDGSTRTVGGNGTVSWSWHEETKGAGGTGSVSCRLGSRTGSANASFSVT